MGAASKKAVPPKAAPPKATPPKATRVEKKAPGKKSPIEKATAVADADRSPEKTVSSTDAENKPPQSPPAVLVKVAGEAEGVVGETKKTGLKEEEEINEFFGGAKKSSKRQQLSAAAESDEDEGMGVVGVADSDADDEQESPLERPGVDLQLIMQKRRYGSKNIDL